MARLPDALPQAAVQGVAPSTAVVPIGDLGLGQAAQTLEQVAEGSRRTADLRMRAQSVRDQEAARPFLLELNNQNQVGLATEGAAYTGETPGFGLDQVTKAQDRANTLRDRVAREAGPTVAAQFSHMANDETARIGAAANAHEAAVRAEPILEAQKARDQVAVSGGLTNFITSFGPAKQQLLDGYDGSQAGLAQGVATAFDAAAAPALEATPERLRPQLQSRLAVMRQQEIGQAVVVEQSGADAHVLANGLSQANAQINGILSNPLSYDSVIHNGLPEIEAAMPVGLRKNLHADLMAAAAAARVNGLIDQGNPGQAQAELSDGRYDEFLKPAAKETLVDRAAAAQRDHGPKTFDEYMAAGDVARKADAETYARATTGRGTGQVNLDEIVQKMGPAQAAKYAQQWQDADREFAAVGPVREKPSADLAALTRTPAPDPVDPDYATKIVAWQATQKAAAEELKARTSPGAWAFTPGPETTAGAAPDRGRRLQDLWQAAQAATGPGRGTAIGTYVGTMLRAQYDAGISGAAMQVVPDSEAARLAAGVVNAPPDQKLHALQALAGLVDAMPGPVLMPDGSRIPAQALLAKQLLAAHLSPMELSAVLDYGDNPAKLGRFVAAQNDPTLAGEVGAKAKKQVTDAVRADLGPYLASVAPLPGALALAQARIDRTALIATGLMIHQHMSPGDAAKAAAADASGDYKYIDTWRMPANQAAAMSVASMGDALHGPLAANGATIARLGASKFFGQLIAKDGAALYAPAGLPGGPAAQRALYSRQVQHNGRWVTAPDDSGLMLMVPHPDGGWDQVADRYGRPVRATWSQLADHAYERAPAIAAPPHTPVAANGKPLPAFSKQAAFDALAWATEGQESGFRDNAKGPDTRFGNALGRMQVIPQFGAPYALRLFGAPIDPVRLQHDNDYNRKIGRAMLVDETNHFGPGAGIGLALASYNAGRGRLEGYRDDKGWHPGWLSTIGDPRKGEISLTDFVARIPIKETRAYVQAILPNALTRLQAGH